MSLLVHDCARKSNVAPTCPHQLPEPSYTLPSTDAAATPAQFTKTLIRDLLLCAPSNKHDVTLRAALARGSSIQGGTSLHTCIHVLDSFPLAPIARRSIVSYLRIHCLAPGLAGLSPYIRHLRAYGVISRASDIHPGTPPRVPRRTHTVSPRQSASSKGPLLLHNLQHQSLSF